MTAKRLKKHLSNTLEGLTSGKITPQQADATSSIAREILRTVRTQLMVSNQARLPVNEDVINFSDGGEE